MPSPQSFADNSPSHPSFALCYVAVMCVFFLLSVVGQIVMEVVDGNITSRYFPQLAGGAAD